MTDYIKSPISYTGNKHRVLAQLMPHVPANVGVMVDLFCGGATVGANIPCQKVVFIDRHRPVIGLLDYLARVKDMDKLIQTLIRLADRFHLSCSGVNGYAVYKARLADKNTNNGLKELNRAGFYHLRDTYNGLADKTTARANNMLYLLIAYGFNNDIRFSRGGNFNLPIGKTDLNRSSLKKIKAFNERMSTRAFEFVCAGFDADETRERIGQSDFVYLDPPYLITQATYNENGQWDDASERKLLDLLDALLCDGKRFMLSNVLEKKGAVNEPLSCWARRRAAQISLIDIDYHYRSASYNKKQRDGNEREIIILPR